MVTSLNLVASPVAAPLHLALPAEVHSDEEGDGYRQKIPFTQWPLVKYQRAKPASTAPRTPSMRFCGERACTEEHTSRDKLAPRRPGPGTEETCSATRFTGPTDPKRASLATPSTSRPASSSEFRGNREVRVLDLVPIADEDSPYIGLLKVEAT